MIENRIPPHRTGAPMAVSTLPPRGTSAAPVAAPSELVQHWIGGRIAGGAGTRALPVLRSEEHTSELQSRVDLVCRLLLEKKKKKERKNNSHPNRRARYVSNQ